MVWLLLERGVDANVEDGDGKTARRLAVSQLLRSVGQS
jgi:hypothetical protein